MTRIVDCFTFYNELDVLKKRLKYLDSKVDKFVLVESTVTFRGNDKPLLFDERRDEFSEWNDKIVHVIVRDNPSGRDPWLREHHQRNCISRGLDAIEPPLESNDIVMIGDVDEIPDLQFVGNFPPNPNVHALTAHMLAFEYSFEWLQTREPWFGTVMTRYGGMKNPQFYRDRRWGFPYIAHMGWHMSSFGDADFVQNKITNFSHCYDDNNAETTREDFIKFRENGLSADGRVQNPRTPREILMAIPYGLRESNKKIISL